MSTITEPDTINICYTCFDFTTPVSILSLIENEKDKRDMLCFYVFVSYVPGAEDAYQKCVNICNRFHLKIKRLDFQSISRFCIEHGWPEWVSTHLAYARLFLPQVLDIEVKRIIYLDADTFINGPISDFWEMSLGDKLIGAIHTPSYTFKNNISYEVVNNLGTANSGVLLMDVEKLRSFSFVDRVKEIKAEDIIYADQCILNRFFPEIIEYYPPLYNSTSYYRRKPYYKFAKEQVDFRRCSKEEYLDAQKHPLIIHFNGSVLERPWYKYSRSKYMNIWQKTCKKVYGHSIKHYNVKLKRYIVVYQWLLHIFRFLPDYLFYFIERKH